MSQSGSPDAIGHLQKLLAQFTYPIVEHEDETTDGVVVCVRFAMIAFPLIGGRGKAATAKEARWLAYRSLADRLCKLCVFNNDLLRIVETHGEAAIDIFTADARELFGHLNEYMQKSKQIPVKVRISKSWDPSLFPSERAQLTREMVSSIGTYWEEQWPELDIPPHMLVKEEEEARELKGEVPSGYEPAETPSSCCGEASRPSTTSPAVAVADRKPETSTDCTVQAPKRTLAPPPPPPCGQKKPRAAGGHGVVASPHSLPLSVGHVTSSGEAGVDLDLDEDEGELVIDEGEEGEKVATPVLSPPASCISSSPPLRKEDKKAVHTDERLEEYAESRSALIEVARLFRTTLQEDESRVFFAGIDPAFLGASKAGGDAYMAMIESIIEWKLLPPTAEEDIAAYVGVLFDALAPLIAKHCSGSARNSEWRRSEIRDIGARFWKRPTEMRLVQWPLSSPSSADSEEGVCQLLVESIATRALLQVVREERGGLSRVSFLSFPCELLGDCAYVEKSCEFSSFVRALCVVSLLPPWLEMMYLLKKKDGRYGWLSAISHSVANGVMRHLRSHYLQNESSTFLSSSDSTEQRTRLKGYLEGLWKSVTVTVPEGTGSEFALSFPAVIPSGSPAWPADAPSLTEETWIARQSVSIFGEKWKKGCSAGSDASASAQRIIDVMRSMVKQQQPGSLPSPSLPSPTRQSVEQQRVDRVRQVAMAALVPPPPPPPPPPPTKEDHFKACAQSLCAIMGWKMQSAFCARLGVEKVYFSGIPVYIASGIHDRSGRGPYECLMWRLRSLWLLPQVLANKVLSLESAEAYMVCSFFTMLQGMMPEEQDGSDARVLGTLHRVGHAFWRIADPPVYIRLIEAAEWRERKASEGGIEFQSRLDEWLLARMADRAGTRLVHAQNKFGAPMLWFRSVSISRLGVIANVGTCPFRYLMSRLIRMDIVCGSVSELEELPGNADKLEAMLTRVAEKLMEMERQEEEESKKARVSKEARLRRERR